MVRQCESVQDKSESIKYFLQPSRGSASELACRTNWTACKAEYKERNPYSHFVSTIGELVILPEWIWKKQNPLTEQKRTERTSEIIASEGSVTLTYAAA